MNNFQNAYLKEVNPWWRNEYKCEDSIKRDCFDDVMKSVKDRKFIVYVSGARRTGKSTLLGQIGDRLFQSRHHLLYCSVEDILSYGNSSALIDELITFYEEQVILSKVKNNILYLILDEIHHLDNWQAIIKRFYDNRKNLKFTLTSSIAPSLQKSRESLTGRIKEFFIQSFSFKEFLLFKNRCTEVLNCPQTIGNQLLSSKKFNREEIKKLIKNILPFQEDLSMMALQYCMNGGMPEALQMEEQKEIKTYFEEIVIRKVINEDIPMGYGVSDRKLLSRLFYYGIDASSNEINMSRIADLQMEKKTTINNYFHYLELGKLLTFIPKHSKSLAGQSRALKKVFAVDSGIFFMLQKFLESNQMRLMGPSAEIAVLNRIRQISSSIYYYRNKKKEEIDFLVETGIGRTILIEVKFRGHVDKNTLLLMKNISGEFQDPYPFIVTKNSMQFHKNGVIEIPLWAFLILF